MALKPMTVHDPGRLALRRGIRLAIGAPVLLAVLLHLLDDPIGIPFGLFFLISVIGTADFAGKARVRALACLATGLASIPVIAAGMASSAYLLTVVVVTLVMGTLLFFLGVLRGLVAAGSVVVISQLAVSVTSTATLAQWQSILTGLATGVVLSIVLLIIVLPTDRRRHVRDRVASALGAMTEVAHLAWDDLSDDARLKAATDNVTAAIAAVNREFGGQPFRPAGVSRRDRALVQLVARIRVLRRAQMALLRQPRSIIPQTRELGVNSGTAMDMSARALRDPAVGRPDASTFPGLLDAHYDSCADWVQARATDGTQVDVIVTELQRAHATRVISTLTEQVAGLVCEALGDEPADRGSDARVAPVRPWWRDLILNANVHSPWLPGAVRGGIAIALGAGIVHVVGLSYGLWVLLGVLAVLRVDAISTRRTAWQVVWGTAAGAVLGTAIVVLADGMNAPWLLWVLLPIFSLLVGWTPTALGSVGISQLAFSVMVLIAFAIIQWPLDLILGLTRLENMALGAMVAIACAFLLWPRGVMGFLRTAVATAVESCARVSSAAVSALTGDVDLDRVRELESPARVELSNSMEVIDLALVQRGSGSRLLPWMRVADTTRALMEYGKLLTHVVERESTTLDPGLAAAVRAAQADAERTWELLAAECLTAQPGTDAPAADDGTAPRDVDLSNVLAVARAIDLTRAINARALCASVWAIDWMSLLSQLSEDAREPLRPRPRHPAASA